MIDLKKLKELGLHQSGRKLWIQAEDVVLLIDQIESAQRDAARYHYLRDEHIGDCPESINLNPHPRKNGLDAAIDTAMTNT